MKNINIRTLIAFIVLLCSPLLAQEAFNYWVPYVDTQHTGRSATHNKLIIYAFEDNTSIQIRADSYSLDAGDSLEISRPVLEEGINVSSNKPVQVYYYFISAHHGAYEDGAIMYYLLEDSYLGTEYFIPIPNKIVSVLATRDSTNIIVNDTTKCYLNAGETERFNELPTGTHIVSNNLIAVVCANYSDDHYSSTYASQLYPTGILGTSYFTPRQHAHTYRSSTDSSLVYILSVSHNTIVSIDTVDFELNLGETVSYPAIEEIDIFSNQPIYVVYLSDVYGQDRWTSTLRHYEFAFSLLPEELGIRRAVIDAQSASRHGFPIVQVCVTSLEDNNNILILTDGRIREWITLDKGERAYFSEGEVEEWDTHPLIIESEASMHVIHSIRSWWSGTSEQAYGGNVNGRFIFNHDVGVMKILEPPREVSLDETYSPTAIVKNHGLNSETFDVAFQIGQIYSSTQSIELSPDEVDTMVFTEWNAQSAGTFNAKCFTDLENDEYSMNDEKTKVIVVNPDSGPIITGISPNSGGNTGSVTVEISGANFLDGSQVFLQREESEDILAHWISAEDSSLITATFDLREQELGDWDVTVVNPDSSLTTYFDGFRVEEGFERLWVNVIGPDQIRFRRESRFIVAYGNTGNVDATYPWVAIGLPWGMDYEIDIPYALSTSLEEENEEPDEDAIDVTLISLPLLSPGEEGLINLIITPDERGELALYAKITTNPDPYFYSLLTLPDSIEFENDPEFQEFKFEPSFIAEMDPSRTPPPGYVLLWEDYTIRGFNNNEEAQGYHIAKSLGDGNFIEMLKYEEGPHLRISTLGDSAGTNGYKGAFRPPHYSEEHGRDVIRRATELIERFGQEDSQSNAVGKLCDNKVEDDYLQSNCLGVFHVLNKEFRGYNLKSFPEIEDGLSNLKQSNPKRREKYKYRGEFRQNSEDANETDKCLEGYQDIIDYLDRQLNVVGSVDPNDKYGPTGFGDYSFIDINIPLNYMIKFENVDTASASAEDIFLIDTLDIDLDWSTLSFGESSHLATTQEIDTTTGIITWRFDDIDLPPNVNPPEGEGFASYSIRPKNDLVSGTEIRNRASIFFDFNDPMATSEVLNTIDAGSPTSAVLTLEPEQPLSTFEVKLSGSDDLGGSGIKNYEIYVSENGGQFDHWLTTDEETVMFSGQNGHTYDFYCIAQDNVGNHERSKSSGEASTLVNLPAGIAVSPNPFKPSKGHTVISFFGDRLPNAKIMIFNKSGMKVRTLQETNGTDRLDWDASNDNGEKLASGVYIWVSKYSDGGEDKGKFAIIK